MIVNKNEVIVVKKKSALAVVIVVVIVVIAVVAAIFFLNNRNLNSVSVKKVESLDDIKSELNISIKNPGNGSNIKYEIENEDVARVSYNITGFKNKDMGVVFRSSSAIEDIAIDYEAKWGVPVLMTTICPDETEVGVTAYLAENPKNKKKTVMKAEWYDNDLYYTMFSDDISSREDFLQEINRVIIENHVEF